MTEEQEKECKLLVGNISALVRDFKKRTGIDYQTYIDTGGPFGGITHVFYTRPEEKKLHVTELVQAAMDLVRRVEAKGSLTKPELLQVVVQLKKFL